MLLSYFLPWLGARLIGLRMSSRIERDAKDRILEGLADISNQAVEQIPRVANEKWYWFVGNDLQIDANVIALAPPHMAREANIVTETLRAGANTECLVPDQLFERFVNQPRCEAYLLLVFEHFHNESYRLEFAERSISHRTDSLLEMAALLTVAQLGNGTDRQLLGKVNRDAASIDSVAHDKLVACPEPLATLPAASSIMYGIDRSDG